MIKKILVSLAVFIIFIVVVFIWQLSAGVKGDKEAAGLPQIKIGENVFSVEIADDLAERARGLSRRQSLAEDRGMLFLFEFPAIQNFWMKDMRFPLDIIWIENNTIVGFSENAPPDNSQTQAIYSSSEPVDKVLEINAGLVKKLGIKIGDRIELP